LPDPQTCPELAKGSQRFNQSFVKELAEPNAQREIVLKIYQYKKIKNADTRADRKDRK